MSCAGRKLVVLLSVWVGMWIAVVCVFGWLLWVWGGGGGRLCVGLGVFVYL